MGLNIVTIIPARGGSKGIPNKNLKLLAGKPLISYTIKHSLSSSLVKRTFVSTDSPRIKAVSEKYGAEVIMRPPRLSGDRASSESAIEHVLRYLEKNEKCCPDIIVFLQCTSPLRRREEIDKAINFMLKNRYDSIVSVYEKSYMIWKMHNGKPKSFNFDYKNRPRRQEKDREFIENGSIFIFKRNSFLKAGNRVCGKAGLYIMPYEYSFDIDEIFDFWLSEKVISGYMREELND